MHTTDMTWFREAKYGLFIHWGLYASLAGEYNGRRAPGASEWIMNDMDIPVEEYEKLAQRFHPAQFDARAWARMAKGWGMKYVVFTAKHHDGFAMYHSACDPYNIVDATPFARDVVRELADACRAEGLKFCLYYSQSQDWHHPDGYRARHPEPECFSRYFEEKCMPQLHELLTNYGEIGCLWFDTAMNMTPAQSRAICDLVKSIQPNCIINGRIGNGAGEYMTTGDNDIPLLPYYGDWEVPATLNDTWGYSRFDHHWKKPADLIRLLLKINSRGGNYLLNVGPTAEGLIPQESVAVLDEIGAYLARCGESIYATQAISCYPYDKETVYFTQKPYRLYVHFLPPVQHDIWLNNIAGEIRRAYLLADGREIAVEALCEHGSNRCWVFHFPEDIVFDPLDTVVCVETAEERPAFIAL